MNILVIEGEPKTAGILKHGIEGAGYSVETASTAAAALEILQTRVFDLMILDSGLPDMDGLDLLRKLRNRQINSLVLILSVRDGLLDRVKGLDTGADDYLAKPFALVELMARIRALLRRAALPHNKLEIGGLVLDHVRRQVTRDGRSIELTPKEFAILEYMMRNEGRPLTRSLIVEHVWGRDYDGLTNIVYVYIRHLRDKVDDRFQQRMIQTIRCVGYLIEAPDRQQAVQ